MVKQKFYKVHHFQFSNGFTLIEILVVMAIIGMLAVMVAPNIFNQQAGHSGMQLFHKYRRLRRH